MVFDAITRAAGGNTMETLAGKPYPAYLGDEILVSQVMPGSVSDDYENVAMLLYGNYALGVTMGSRRGFRARASCRSDTPSLINSASWARLVSM